MLQIDRLETDIGTLVLAARGGKLEAIAYAEADRHAELIDSLADPAVTPPARRPRAAADRPKAAEADDPFGFTSALRAYFAGDLAAIDALTTEARGTEFQHAVWRVLRTIPVGATLTYSEVAEQIGKPKAVRAVGLASARNPVSIVVPCHRVVGKNRCLTGYAGGLGRKEWLLRHEGADA